MEVIPLDDRVRSTTVLNSTAASDAPEFNTTVYPDDASTFEDEELAAAAAGGLWTRKNKLLLSLVAGSALFCAVATGGGIAAHRARVNANRCFESDLRPIAAMPAPAGKSSKSPSTKSSKAPSAKSSKAPSATSTPVTRKLTGTTVDDASAMYDQDDEEILRKAGLTAHYPVIPKTVEDRRKNRMLAQHLGQPDVADNTVSWVRRLQTASPGAKSSKSPSTKSSKAPSAKSSKAPGGAQIAPAMRPGEIDCKCVNPAGFMANGSSSGAKSSKSPSTKSSKSPSTKSSKSPSATRSPSTKSSKSPSTKSSKSPSTKSSKSPSSSLTEGLRPTLPPITCQVPVSLTPRPPAPVNGGGSFASKSSKAPSSNPGPIITPVIPVPEPAPKPEPVPVVPPPPVPTPPATTPVDPPCEEGDDCDSVPPPVEEPVPPVPTPPVEEQPVPPPPVPTPPVSTPAVPTPTPPNCENDADWATDRGDTCASIGSAEDSASLCALQDSTGVTASDACPAVCNDECIVTVNCDNDEDWSSTTGADCDAVASDPDTLCSEVDSAGVSATDACPASCNEECIVTLNCDNDEDWSSTTGNNCAAVAEDPKMLCMEMNSDGESASDACPASCNVECFPEPPFVPLIPVPVPSPSTTTKPSVSVTETVGTPENKDTLSPTRAFLLSTPLPTEFVTIAGSEGGTITVSTETTGPPTVEVRDGERR